MSLKKYEVFAKTVELGSLTRAAEALGSTQSRISHVLAELEAEFGFSSPAPQPQRRVPHRGRHLVLPKIQEILRENQALSQLAAEIRCADAGTVRLGAFTSVAVHWLPGIIQTFQAHMPRSPWSFSAATTTTWSSGFARAAWDLGFVTLPAPAGFEAVPLCDDELLAVLPLHHPLAAAEAVPIGALADAPFISLPQRALPTTSTGRWTRPGCIPKSSTPPRTTTPSSPWWSRGWACPSCRNCCSGAGARAWPCAPWSPAPPEPSPWPSPAPGRSRRWTPLFRPPWPGYRAAEMIKRPAIS